MYLPCGKQVGLEGKQGSVDRTELLWLTSFKAVKGSSERLFCWVLGFYLWEMGWEYIRDIFFKILDQCRGTLKG